MKPLTRHERIIAWYWIKAWLDDPDIYTPRYIQRRVDASYRVDSRKYARRGLVTALAIIKLAYETAE